jgi:hypothetical protein
MRLRVKGRAMCYLRPADDIGLSLDTGDPLPERGPP